MLVAELQIHDRLNAFAEFIPVSEAKATGKIPLAFHSSFDDHCKCGSERMITETCSQIMCCDPRCPYKIAGMLEETFSRFQIGELGPSFCEQLTLIKYDALKIKSHLCLLLMEPADYPDMLYSAKGQKFVNAVQTIMSSPITFPQLISRLGFPLLDDSAEKALKGINSALEFKEEVAKSGGLQMFLAQRGIYDTKKVFYFDHFFGDMILAEYLLSNSLIMQGLQQIGICMTGDVVFRGSKITKAAYIDLLNKLCTLPNGIRVYEFRMNTAKMTAPFIVADYPSSTSKYRVGLERNRGLSEDEKVMLSSDELFNKFEKIMQQYKEVPQIE